MDADDPTVGLAVNPTYVGMDRNHTTARGHPNCKPHVCGDGPEGRLVIIEEKGVNPTYVGMDRKIPSPMTQSSSKPHVCGDGPVDVLAAGSTTTVSPTYVGMDRPAARNWA